MGLRQILGRRALRGLLMPLIARRTVPIRLRLRGPSSSRSAPAVSVSLLCDVLSPARGLLSCDPGAMFVPDEHYLNVWTFPIAGPDAPHDAPANIVGACHAVGRDLQCRWHGPDTYVQNCLWTVSVLDSGHCHLLLAAGPRPRCKTVGTTTLKSLGFGGLHIEQSVQELTVFIAGEVQDQLAGGMPFVQWPINEQRLLMPTLRDGNPVWVARSADRVIADIGALCSR